MDKSGEEFVKIKGRRPKVDDSVVLWSKRALKGIGRPWPALEGLGGLWRALEGLGRPNVGFAFPPRKNSPEEKHYRLATVQLQEAPRGYRRLELVEFSNLSSADLRALI